MSYTRVLAFIGFLIVLAGIAFGLSALAPRPVACTDCNVVIIGVDTLRADRIHAFGYGRETTPNIDALARDSFSFTNAVSASSWTVPSFMSIFTGVYPSVHKVVNKYVEYDPNDPAHQILSNLKKLSPDTMTLAEAMKAHGYATGGFTGDAGVGHAFGYAQGFDVYTDETTFGTLSNSGARALSWLDSLPTGQKFFMFFHGYDLHGQAMLAKEGQTFVPKGYTGPYTGSAQEEAVLREAQLTQEGISLTTEDVAFWNGLYDSKILAADAEVGTFIEALKERGLYDRTIIILVSDHGEEYYEHGGIDHGHTLYDELVRVPLIMRVPGYEGGRTTAQVSTMDVAPTLASLLGVSYPAPYARQLIGRDLSGFLTNPGLRGEDAYLETDYREYVHERGIRSRDGYKYVINLNTGREELYDLSTDPKEMKNIVETDLAHAATLRAKVRMHMKEDLGADPDERPKIGCLPVYPTECQ